MNQSDIINGGLFIALYDEESLNEIKKDSYNFETVGRQIVKHLHGEI